MTFKEYDFLIMGSSFSGNYQILGVGPSEPFRTNILIEMCVFPEGCMHTVVTTAMSGKLRLIVDI